MKDPLRQPMPVATRLESGEILRTEADYAAVNDALAAAAAAQAAAVGDDTPSETTSTPAESGAGEELNYDG